MKFRNDFIRLHAVFFVLYLLTFIVGWFRTEHIILYRAHPILGISSVVIPLGLYFISKNKKLIRQMIKVNFNYKGKPVLIVAKASTQVIAFYYIFSILTGFLLNNGLYTGIPMYLVLARIHGASRIIVPVAVLTHVISRLYMKQSRKRKA